MYREGSQIRGQKVAPVGISDQLLNCSSEHCTSNHSRQRNEHSLVLYVIIDNAFCLNVWLIRHLTENL